MILDAFFYKSKIKNIEKKYSKKTEQYEALQKYGAKIGIPQSQLHYYEMPYEVGIEEQLSEIKDKICIYCQIEISNFWRRIAPYVLFFLLVVALVGITIGIIKIVVSSEKWTAYPHEPFQW